MKKHFYIILLASLLLLCACQPTPETEFVINKGDNVLEQKLYATPEPVADTVSLHENASAAPESEPANEPTAEPVKQQLFPDRWDEDGIKLREHATLSIHTDIETRADGQYPAYRTKAEPFTEEQVIRFAEILLPKPVELELIEAKTKQELQNELQQYLDEVADWEEWVATGKQGDRDDTGFDPEEVKKTTDWYMNEIKHAPDTLDAVPVSDYSSYRIGQQAGYRLENGESATITTFVGDVSNVLQISNRCKRYGYVYYETQYQKDLNDPGFGNDKLWMDAALSQEDAEATLKKGLDRLGLNGFEIRYAERATLLDTSETRTDNVSGGWGFQLSRSFGYPLIDVPFRVSDNLDFGSSDGYSVNKPIRNEEIEVFIDEYGIECFLYSGQKTVLREVNPNVELLPFADIQRIVENTLSVSYPGWAMGDDMRTFDIEIYQMVLMTQTLRVPDSDDYYEVPCWVVLFDGLFERTPEGRAATRNDRGMSHDAIIINAVDGTVVIPEDAIPEPVPGE